MAKAAVMRPEDIHQDVTEKLRDARSATTIQYGERSMKELLADAAFIRARAELQPAAGEGEPVTPARYPDAKRWDPNTKKVVNTPFCWAERDGERNVVLSSWGAEAHAMADALDGASVCAPQLVVDFKDHPYPSRLGLKKLGSRQLSHRYASAEIRDSLLEGEPFTKSEQGKAILAARPESDCRALYRHDPFAILCGGWNSHSDMSSEKAPKFGRMIVAAIRAHGAEPFLAAPVKTDTLRIPKEIDMHALCYEGRFGKKKDDRPSTYGYGSVTQREGPRDAAVTMSHARFTWTLSLQALRDLRFGDWTVKQADAARRALMGLALVMLARRFERGFHLRSTCDLVVVKSGVERIDRATLDREAPRTSPLALSSCEAEAFLDEAVQAACKLDANWAESDIELDPDPDWLKKVLDKAEELES